MKVVLDTNVLLAAFATRGLCEAVLHVCLLGHDLVLSEPILGELRRHLRTTLRLPAAHTRSIISFLRKQAAVVRPAKVPTDSCRDPTDLPVLGTALAAQADCLVTGDGDLLALGSFRGTAILSPRVFHDRLG